MSCAGKTHDGDYVPQRRRERPERLPDIDASHQPFTRRPVLRRFEYPSAEPTDTSGWQPSDDRAYRRGVYDVRFPVPDMGHGLYRGRYVPAGNPVAYEVRRA